MTNIEELYNKVIQQKAARQRQNIESFIVEFEKQMTGDLDKLYQTDKERYNISLANVKKQGIRVFRNDEGKHKLDCTNMLSNVFEHL